MLDLFLSSEICELTTPPITIVLAEAVVERPLPQPLAHSPCEVVATPLFSRSWMILISGLLDTATEDLSCSAFHSHLAEAASGRRLEL